LTSVSNVSDGTFHFVNYYTATDYGDYYWWAVNASDDNSYTNTSFSFRPVRGGGSVVSGGGGVGLAVGAAGVLLAVFAVVLIFSRRRKNNNMGGGYY